MIRRIRSHVLGLLALALLVAACGAPGGEEEVSGQDVGGGATEEAAAETEDAGDDTTPSGDPIRIGFLAATTGTAAASGEDMVRGWDLYWKVNGDTVAGRQVETFHEDTAGDPQVGLNKAQRLVENEQVSLVVGPLFANVGYAVAEYLGEQGVPNFQQVSSADDLTQRGRIDGVLRVGGWTSSQTAHPAGQWAYDQGYRRAPTTRSARSNAGASSTPSPTPVARSSSSSGLRSARRTSVPIWPRSRRPTPTSSSRCRSAATRCASSRRGTASG
jgi:hypothetical protein